MNPPSPTTSSSTTTCSPAGTKAEFSALPRRTSPAHPDRASGRTYQNQLYSAADHYSDSTVALFIPKGFRAGSRIDFVVHFHGWRNHAESVLRHYELIDQLIASGRNAVLVVPQGPKDAPDSFDGKLEDAGGFQRFMEEAAATLRRQSQVKLGEFKLGHIILSGHSGGYQVISSILDRGGLSDQVREVWLFDALYGQTEKFLAWSDREHGRMINIYTDHGGTHDETERLMTTLGKRGTHYLAGNESEIKTADLLVPCGVMVMIVDDKTQQGICRSDSDAFLEDFANIRGGYMLQHRG